MAVAILENDVSTWARYPSAMLSEWLQRALEERGMSQAEFSRRLTEKLGRSIDRAAVNKMLSKGPKARKISADEMLAASEILDFPAPATDTPASLRTVTVAAHVQAGHWAESWEWSDDEQYPVAVPTYPELAGFRLFAAETRGPSMNRRWPEGTVVVFTRVEETGEMPVAGKRYVVERKRLSGEAEHTVKLLHRDSDGRYWLVPESDDPRFQTAISVEDGSKEGDEIAIIGRVHFAVTRE